MRGDEEHSTTKVASEPAALIPFPPGLPISQCADGYMHGTPRAMGGGADGVGAQRRTSILTGIRSLLNMMGRYGHGLHTLRIVRFNIGDREPIRFRR